MSKVYINAHMEQGVETLCEYDSKEFDSYTSFNKEVHRVVNEYRMSGTPAYSSSRCTKFYAENSRSY